MTYVTVFRDGYVFILLTTPEPCQFYLVLTYLSSKSMGQEGDYFSPGIFFHARTPGFFLSFYPPLCHHSFTSLGSQN